MYDRLLSLIKYLRERGGVVSALDDLYTALPLWQKLVLWGFAQGLLFRFQETVWNIINWIYAVSISTAGDFLELRIQTALLLIVIAFLSLQTSILILKLNRMEEQLSLMAQRPRSAPDGGFAPPIEDIEEEDGGDDSGSGVGAVGGAVAGAALGSTYGPAGTVGGALLGAILGDELEKESDPHDEE